MACKFSGVRYDIGSPLGFLEANIGLALAREDLQQEMRTILGRLLQTAGL